MKPKGFLVLPLVWWICIASADNNKLNRHCNETENTKESETGPCKTALQKITEGFFVDFDAMNEKRPSEVEVEKLIKNWAAQKMSKKSCIFAKLVPKTKEVCCSGWSGKGCSLATCEPQCQNGGICEAPNVCNCDKTRYCGDMCQIDPQGFEADKGYCFTEKGCKDSMSGEDALVDKETCCSLKGGASWGICQGKKCDPCSNSNALPDFPRENPKILKNSPQRTCFGSGTNYWQTFDGLEYYFQGCCTYTLLQDSKRWITLRNFDCTTASTSKELSIKPDGVNKVVASCDQIDVNGKQVTINDDNPGYAEGVLRIRKIGEYFIFQYGVLTVGWNCDGDWFIEVAEVQKKENSTEFNGLCGNYDGNPENDHIRNDLKVDPATFGDSWSFNGAKCPPVLPYAPRCKNIKALQAARKACAVINENPFITCHNMVQHHNYHARCVTDYCAAEGSDDSKDKTKVVCKILNEYSTQCSRSKTPFQWRTNKLCPKTCKNKDMKYIENINSCAPNCANIDRAEDSCPNQAQYPGCRCPPGKFEHAGKCFNAKDCPCKYQDAWHPTGTTIPSSCNTCTCKFGDWECTKKSCPMECSVLGLQHLTTFDGYFYNYQTPECLYTLVESENGKLTISMQTQNAGLSGAFQTRAVGVKVVINNKDKIYVTSAGLKIGLTLNGAQTDPSKPIINKDFSIVLMKNSWAIIQGKDFQIRVGIGGSVFVKLSPAYAGKVNGLCGNMNGKLDDEFTVKSGIIETKYSFVLSYSNCPDKQFQPNPNVDPCLSNTAVRASQRVQDRCSHLKNATLLGDACFNSPSSTDHYEACLNDLCVEINAAGLSSDAAIPSICTFLTKKATECAEQGLPVTNWPQGALIKDMCPDRLEFACAGNMVYQLCSDVQRKCHDLGIDKELEERILTSLGKTCVPGCACPQGMYLDDYNNCVLVKQCTCFDNATQKIYAPESTLKKECQNCVCERGEWNCEDANADKSCAKGLIFKEDYRACTSTCASYGDCSAEAATCGACACPGDQVLNDKGKCIDADLCPCEHLQKLYASGEQVISNGKKCTCKKRKWDCAEDDNFRGQCKLFGDVYYISFDGVHRVHKGQASCAYILVQTIDGAATYADCDKVYIAVSNLPCGQSGVICTKVVTARIGNLEVKLAKGASPSLNGVDVDLTGGIYATKSVSFISTLVMTIVSFEDGITIVHDGGTKVVVYLPSCYKHKVNGLCGKFGVHSSSASAPDATPPTAWKVDPECPTSDDNDFNPCKAHPERVSWATQSCSIITKGAQFAECRKQVDYEQFFQECMAASCDCDTGGDCKCMCTAIEHFASTCSEKGSCVQWRSNHFCPVMCPEGQIFKECELTQNHTCQTAKAGASSVSEIKVEGCFCPKGTVLGVNNQCIEPIACDCKYEGKSYLPGNKTKIDCKECECVNGEFECKGKACEKLCDEKKEFECKGENICISKSHVCDGVKDCRDESDEKECLHCQPGQFECKSGECIGENFLCDGHADCKDASDEPKNCKKCNEDQYKCKNGKCIPVQFVCDGKVDCAEDGDKDKSDEKNCPTRPPTTTTKKTKPTTTVLPTTAVPCKHTDALTNPAATVQATPPNKGDPKSDIAFPPAETSPKLTVTLPETSRIIAVELEVENVESVSLLGEEKGKEVVTQGINELNVVKIPVEKQLDSFTLTLVKETKGATKVKKIRVLICTKEKPGKMTTPADVSTSKPPPPGLKKGTTPGGKKGAIPGDKKGTTPGGKKGAIPGDKIETTVKPCVEKDLLKEPETKVSTTPGGSVPTSDKFTLIPSKKEPKPIVTVESKKPTKVMQVTADVENVKEVVVKFLDQKDKVVDEVKKPIQDNQFTINGQFPASKVVIEFTPDSAKSPIKTSNLKIQTCGEELTTISGKLKQKTTPQPGGKKPTPAGETTVKYCAEEDLIKVPGTKIRTTPGGVSPVTDKFDLAPTKKDPKPKVLIESKKPTKVMEVTSVVENVREVVVTFLDADDKPIDEVKKPIKDDKFSVKGTFPASKIQIQLTPEDKDNEVRITNLKIQTCGKQFTTTAKIMPTTPGKPGPPGPKKPSPEKTTPKAAQRTTPFGETTVVICAEKDLIKDKETKVKTGSGDVIPTSDKFDLTVTKKQPKPSVVVESKKPTQVMQVKAVVENVKDVVVTFLNEKNLPVDEVKKTVTDQKFSITGKFVASKVEIVFTPEDSKKPVEVKNLKVQTCGEELTTPGEPGITPKSGPEKKTPKAGPKKPSSGSKDKKPKPGPDGKTPKPGSEGKTPKPGPKEPKPGPGEKTPKPGPDEKTPKPGPGKKTPKPGPEEPTPRSKEKPGPDGQGPDQRKKTTKPGPGQPTQKPGKKTTPETTVVICAKEDLLKDPETSVKKIPGGDTPSSSVQELIPSKDQPQPILLVDGKSPTRIMEVTSPVKNVKEVVITFLDEKNKPVGEAKSPITDNKFSVTGDFPASKLSISFTPEDTSKPVKITNLKIQTCGKKVTTPGKPEKIVHKTTPQPMGKQKPTVIPGPKKPTPKPGKTTIPSKSSVPQCVDKDLLKDPEVKVKTTPGGDSPVSDKFVLTPSKKEPKPTVTIESKKPTKVMQVTSEVENVKEVVVKFLDNKDKPLDEVKKPVDDNKFDVTGNFPASKVEIEFTPADKSKPIKTKNLKVQVCGEEVTTLSQPGKPTPKALKPGAPFGKTTKATGGKPTKGPGGKPTKGPGGKPTKGPGGKPTKGPGGKPTKGPGDKPTKGPGGKPTKGPGGKPTKGPGGKPTKGPGGKPTNIPKKAGTTPTGKKQLTTVSRCEKTDLLADPKTKIKTKKKKVPTATLR